MQIGKHVQLYRAKESLLIQVSNCAYMSRGPIISVYIIINLRPLFEGGQLKVKIIDNNQGIARTQSPTNKNCAFELPKFGAIVGVSQTEVQWDGLILEELS